MNSKTLPFTYLIGWSVISKYYYGVRFAENCHPDDLWKTYWTSSKVVKSYRKKYGEPDIISIRKVFKNKYEAISWEERVLKRLNLSDPFRNIESKWLNSGISGAIMLNDEQIKNKTIKMLQTRSNRNYVSWCKGMTKDSSESVRKISDYHAGRAKSEEHKKKIGDSNRGKKKRDTSKIGRYERTGETISKMLESRKNYITSEETKGKISAALKGKRRGVSTGPLSETTRKKMSERRAGKTSHKKGKKTYTDGIICKMFPENQQPCGWYLYRRLGKANDIV